MSATDTAPAPRGLARAEQSAQAEAQRLAEHAAAAKLRELHNAKARRIRLEKLARGDRRVRELLQEHAALRTSFEQLTARFAALETQHATQVTAGTALAEECVALRADLAKERAAHVITITAEKKAAADIARLGTDLEAARSESAQLRAQLAKLKDSKSAKGGS